jgi:acyl dehydratase
VKFADFYPGQTLTLGPISVSEQDIVEFARRYDPQWFRVDREKAARRFAGVLASGWQVCGLAMRLVSEHVLAGSESMGSPGVAYVHWPTPVLPDELLTLQIEVLEVRNSDRKPDMGVVRWRWRLRHEDGRDALDLEATSLFELRSHL